jgi:hypothetical protein
MSYIDHVLSSLRSLNKERGTHLSGWGEELKEVGQVFENPLWKLLPPLKMAHVFISSYSWVILLSLSHTNSMCHHTFSSSRRVLLFLSHYILGTHRFNAAKSVFVLSHVQGKFHFKPSICSISNFHFLCQSILIRFTILHHFPMSVLCR